MVATNAALIFDQASGTLRRIVYPDTDAETADIEGPCGVAVAEIKTLLSRSVCQKLNPKQIFALTGTLAAQIANDGSANATAGLAAQHPTLLDGIAWRPFWNVAGVDFGVGYSGQLTDWQSLSSADLTITPSATLGVRLDNVNGFTFQNVDFSLHGGTIVYLNNCNNTVFINCNFGGTNLAADSSFIIQSAGTSSGLRMTGCTMDGGGAGTELALIKFLGAVVIQYCWFKNFPQQVFDSAGDTALDFRFNLIDQGGMQAGAHLNYLQLGSGSVSVVWEFNTTIQSPQAGGAGEGPQFYFNSGGTLISASLSNNTMIATPSGAMSAMIHGSGDASGQTPGNGGFKTTLGVGPFEANDNFFNPVGAQQIFYSGSFFGWSAARNIDMTTGNTVSPS